MIVNFMADIEVLILDRLIDTLLDPAAPHWDIFHADKSSTVDLRPNRQGSRPSRPSSNMRKFHHFFAIAPRRLIMRASFLAQV